jgi:hypothetical protein
MKCVKLSSRELFLVKLIVSVVGILALTSSANSSQSLIEPKNKTHIALLYDNEDGLYSAVADYLNEGLTKGELCVYASVRIRDEGHTEKIAPLIKDYHTHIENGNLLVVDLASHYISALTGDMKPFEEAKKLFVEKSQNRANKHVRFVGDGTGFLFKNKHFDVCEMIEQWWQDKPFEGSYVCPFPKEFLDSYPHKLYAKQAVLDKHDVVLEASKVAEDNKQQFPDLQSKNQSSRTMSGGSN